MSQSQNSTAGYCPLRNSDLTLINKQAQKPGKSLERFHLEIRDKLEVLSPQSVEELGFCAAEQKTDGLGITRDEEKKNMLCIVTNQVKLG